MVSRFWRQQLKHDDISLLISEELERRGWETDLFVQYERGELDVYATKGRYQLVVEVKTTDHAKARSKCADQLGRARDYLFKNERVFYFYAHGDGKGGYELHRRYDHRLPSSRRRRK